jgi:deoxyinosine 3'endonuclease (endonuclease V)
MVHSEFEYTEIKHPYVPGFLAFREGPCYLKVYEKALKKKPELEPDLIIFDGNGVLHNRRCGTACHMGLLFDTPSIGVAKKFYDIDGLKSVI